MAIFDKEFIFNKYIASDYITFNEAVDFLIETYNISVDDAVFVVEDYIEEASAKDAYKQKEQGDRIYSQKRGMTITNQELKRNGHIKEDIPKINMDKVNNVKDKTDKEKIRDATRSIGGSVPKYGANPKYSRDADKKAVEAYKRSTSKNPYKNIDIDKSVAGMDEKKAAMVKRSLERGSDLPESIKTRLVKKDNGPAPGETLKRGGTNVRKFFDNKSDAKKQMDRIHTMTRTTDPAEYHINRKAFLKDMGQEKYKGTILSPRYEDDEDEPAVYFKKQPHEESLRKSSSTAKKKTSYYHTSQNPNITKLYPTPKAGEGGIFYPQARIYASKDAPTARTGTPVTLKNKKDWEDYNYNFYKLSDSDLKGKKINKEDLTVPTELDRASYIKTSRPISVSKHTLKY